MNRSEKETEFLRQCMAYDDSAERHRLEERIARVQHDQHSLRRAMWLLGWLTAPAVAVLGYGALFLDYYPQVFSPLLLMIVSSLGLGTAVCLLAFAGLEVVYRRELDQRRAECLRLLARILASHLGEPVTAPVPNLSQNGRAEETPQPSGRPTQSMVLTQRLNRPPELKPLLARRARATPMMGRLPALNPD